MAASFPLEIIGRILIDDDIVDESLGCFAGYSRHGLLAWIGVRVGLASRKDWDSRMLRVYFLYPM